MDFSSFQDRIQVGNQEQIRPLTPSDAGYHGAYHTNVVTPPPHTAAAAAPPPVPAHAPVQHVSVEGGTLYYCWTHGLSPNRNHTSTTCLHKSDGHRHDAKAFRMHGGNNTIATGRPRRFPVTTRK